MTKTAIIERTLSVLTQLPPDKVAEVSDFADFVLKKFEDELLAHGAQRLTAESAAFQFLADEEDLYSADDLKERFRDEG